MKRLFKKRLYKISDYESITKRIRKRIKKNNLTQDIIQESVEWARRKQKLTIIYRQI